MSVPKISIIAAVAENNVIGANGGMPWQQDTDLKRFKELTLNKVIIMGRNTWNSLPGLLNNRRHIIISSKKFYKPKGCLVFSSLNEALLNCKSEEEVMIIGGTKLFAEALPIANYMYLTTIHAQPTGDTFFPEYNEADWAEIHRQFIPRDKDNQYDTSFRILTKYKRVDWLKIFADKMSTNGSKPIEYLLTAHEK